VLRQGNLNPEIEEKLLTLQRYQEKQAKGEFFDATTFAASIATSRSARAKTNIGYNSPDDSDDSEEDEDSDNSSKPASRRRGGTMDDDDDWVVDAPKKYIKKADRERMERKRDSAHFPPAEKSPHEKEQQKIIVKTSETGQIRKNIIFCNRVENPTTGQSTFTIASDAEKSPEKALLASKLKMKAAAAQKSSVNDEVKNHKLHVSKHQHAIDLIV
jgi:hypothetical protein